MVNDDLGSNGEKKDEVEIKRKKKSLKGPLLAVSLVKTLMVCSLFISISHASYALFKPHENTEVAP